MERDSFVGRGLVRGERLGRRATRRRRPSGRPAAGARSRGCAAARRAGPPSSRAARRSPPRAVPGAPAAAAGSRGAVTPSASIRLVPRTPPLIFMIRMYGRVASSTALASAASSVPNAIAVGPSSSGLNASPRRAFGGDPHQAVLDDVVGHVLLAQRAADLGELAHLEAAVLGDDERCGCARSPRAAPPPSPAWPLSAC